MIDDGQLARIVDRVVSGYAPDVVGLFGSYAIGRATERSDLDLVVIKRTAEPARRRAAYVRHLIPMMRKVDVVVLTPEELDEARRVPHTFHHTVACQIKVLYVRPGVDRAALRL